MKIIVSYTEASAPYYDNESPCETLVENNEGKQMSVSFGAGEPEDMSLGRDLSDAFRIKELVKFAYECGKNNEDIEVVEQEYPDWD